MLSGNFSIPKDLISLIVRYIQAIESYDEEIMRSVMQEIDKYFFPNDEWPEYAPQEYVDVMELLFQIDEYYGEKSPFYINPEELNKSKKAGWTVLQAYLHIVKTKWPKDADGG